MSYILEIKAKVLNGYEVTKDDAMLLAKGELYELCCAADELRYAFCGKAFDLCTIINGKSGRCSENCKYCAQSSFFDTAIEEYPLLDKEPIVSAAVECAKRGVQRFSIVTSGKRLCDAEVNAMCEAVRDIHRACNISVCVSFGLLNEAQFRRLRAAGVARVHNNLETSRRNFANVCTTHSFDDKIAAIQAALRAGLSVCSGGIFGLGETMQDRIDMALSLRELGISSVPINMLNAISGTPYEHIPKLTSDEMCRIVAVYRFILPRAYIRLAGGRSLSADKGKAVFKSGANAAITGDMLTTAGISIANDKELIAALGYEVNIVNE